MATDGDPRTKVWDTVVVMKSGQIEIINIVKTNFSLLNLPQHMLSKYKILFNEFSLTLFITKICR